MVKSSKVAKFVLVVLAAALIINLILDRLYPGKAVKFGVTFSPRYAAYLKLDFQKTYISILDDLQVRKLRIPTYWDKLEPKEKVYDFSQTDYMLNEAAKRGAQVMLVVGQRQPRWPECHIPVWAKSLGLEQRREKLLSFIGQTVQRYKDHPAVTSWQVENEPFLPFFGENCDNADTNFLRVEANLVRSFNNKRIIMSDSGELGSWIASMQLSDIFGTTIYRKVYDKYLGYVSYPVPPYFYGLKSDIIKNLFARSSQKTIIVELQAEPWLADGNFRSADQQADLFKLNDFQTYANFAYRTGFDEAYLWGVEWWYYMAQNNHPQYLNFAKTLFK